MAFKEYDCGPPFSPNMFCLRAHPCDIIRHQSKRTNKPRETFANHSRTDRERFANEAEYLRDRIRFQHKPKNFRTCILAESNPFLIVRQQFRYAAVLFVVFVFFCGTAGSFSFWVYAVVSYESWFYAPWGALADTTARCDAHLYYAGVSSESWFYSQWGTCRGIIRAAGCSFFVTANSTAHRARHPIVNWALRAVSPKWCARHPIVNWALRAVSPKWCARHPIANWALRAVSPKWCAQHPIANSALRAVSPKWCTRHPIANWALRAVSPQMVCTTPNRELGVASCFAQMVCATPNRELGIVSCFAQMVCTTPNGIGHCELSRSNCSLKQSSLAIEVAPQAQHLSSIILTRFEWPSKNTA